MSKTRIYFAPLQGFTELPYRLAHNQVCGGVDVYCAPFIRLEHGQIRRKDLRDLNVNDEINLLPQVIAASKEEFMTLSRAVLSLGYNTIDLNMGCPFPMQTKRGRGAALVSNPSILKEILDSMKALSDENEGKISFSVKMRLGLDDSSEFKQVLPLLNDSVIKRVAIHPRIARQQYSGELYMDDCMAFCDECKKPVIFNGDLKSVSDIENILETLPNLIGVMIGRGLLSRPTLAYEYKNDIVFSDDEVRQKVLSIHEKVLSYYEETLEGGDGQILQKMVPFWDYMEPLFPHKAVKAIRKTGSLKNYMILVQAL